MSSEPSLSDVPNVMSRLHNLRLSQEDGDEPQQMNLAASGDSSPEPIRNTLLIANVTLPRVRRALAFICDEDQPTSSMARSGETSFSNGDK